MAGSLRPSEAKSGGLLDDADVTIKQARFVRYDYGGKAEKPALASRWRWWTRRIRRTSSTTPRAT